MEERAPYASLDHALRRAYADPRANYGKTLALTKTPIDETTPLLDQIAQDGIVRQVVEHNLNAGQRLIVYLVYDTTERKYNALAALDSYTEIFSDGQNRYFVLESIARWSYRQWPERDPLLPKKHLHGLDHWCERFHVKRWRLCALRAKIYDQLDAMFASAQATASVALVERGLIPGEN